MLGAIISDIFDSTDAFRSIKLLGFELLSIRLSNSIGSFEFIRRVRRDVIKLRHRDS
jgi:hypothetical protein